MNDFNSPRDGTPPDQTPNRSPYTPYQPYEPTYYYDPSGYYLEQAQKRRTFRWKKPLLFYLLTWFSTTFIGQMYSGGGFLSGLWFSVPLMMILTCHEFGHYFQSRRYGVYSTLPFFIPVPFPPFGTFGAFIQMDARIPNRRALFDIGITGPLAGLVPTLIFMFIGIALSSVESISSVSGGLTFGEPILFRAVSTLFFDRSVPGTDLMIHPIAMAAWTGLFITSLNLIPIGQLDGGHVFYALLHRHAPAATRLLFALIVAAVVLFEQWQWIVMVLLVLLIGVVHPPTADDSVKIGRFRTVLGIATLVFVFIGLTPNPIQESEPVAPPQIEAPAIPDLKPMLSYRSESVERGMKRDLSAEPDSLFEGGDSKSRKGSFATLCRSNIPVRT